jgi:hypothetical protein
MLGSESAQRSSVKPRRFNLRLPVPRQVRSTWGYFSLVPAAPISLTERARCLTVLLRYVLQVKKWKRIVVNSVRDTGITDGYLHVPAATPPVMAPPLSEQPAAATANST